MTYSDYIACDREELLARMSQLLSQKRLDHCLRVEKAAIALAKRYGVDEVKAGLAGLLHDYCKELPDQDFLDLIDQHGLDPDLKNWGNNVWHGLVGAYKIRKDLGLDDDGIFSAIAHHTVGSERMTPLEMVVYVADYIEEGRRFPGVDQARLLAQLSLEAAVAYETCHTVAYLAQQGQPIFPQTFKTYNAYCNYLKEDKRD